MQIFWWFMNLIIRALEGLQGVRFQNWSQISPKSILALHTMKKLTGNSNMTFWYLPRSIDTNFLVVYEPYRALEGLQGVAFQGKNCLTKMVPNFSETDFGFS